MTVASVRRGGVTEIPGPASDAIVFTHANNRLRLVLPTASRAGEEFTFTVRYRGIPAKGLLFSNNIHGERGVFSENWPNRARHWLPMIDHPYDKATGEIIVTAPYHYQVVSNGCWSRNSTVRTHGRLTHWKQSVPIASWLYTLGVARFSVHHAGITSGVPVQTWVFPQDRDAGLSLFEELSRRAMDFFVSHIGPFPYEKLANIEAAGLRWRHGTRQRDLLR